VGVAPSTVRQLHWRIVLPINTPVCCSSLSSSHTHFSIIYNIAHFFSQITNMCSNYYQYGNDDSNFFSEVYNNNTDFGEILPNYAQSSSYANEVSTFNPIIYYLNYSNSSFYLVSYPPVQSKYLSPSFSSHGCQELLSLSFVHRSCDALHLYSRGRRQSQ
jgi:hypothetical protein